GRIAEDFKLLSGTWVNTTEVRSRCLTALDDLVMDVVIAGQDRDDLALLIFPSRRFSAQDHEALGAALRRINDGQSGSSRVIAHAAIVNDMPDATAGEVTEKGSLNARRILENRSELIAQ